MLLIKYLGRCRKPSKVHDQVVIYDSAILKATFWISSVIAIMMRIASIAVLTDVESQTVKLGVIAALTHLKYSTSMSSRRRHPGLLLGYSSVCVTHLKNMASADGFQVHSRSDCVLGSEGKLGNISDV